MSKIKKKMFRISHPWPDVHIGSENLRLIKIPGEKNKVYVRKTRSDVERICEYLDNIYVKKNRLDNMINKNAITTIIDVGANIGLSTYSLLKHFPYVKKVVGIEADEKNYGVLTRNYENFAKIYPWVEFVSINKIAACDKRYKYNSGPLSQELNLTASGTSSYTRVGTQLSYPNEKVVTLDEVLDAESKADVALKVDIEGGEEDLFSKNLKWLQRISYFTCEIHDRFSINSINSSRNVLKFLINEDFAIVPGMDTIHAYRRSELS